MSMFNIQRWSGPDIVTQQMLLNKMLMKCGIKYGTLTIHPNHQTLEWDLDFKNNTHGVRFSIPSHALDMPLDNLDRWLNPAVSTFKLQVSKG